MLSLPLKREKTLLAFFGHHKCATKWVSAILADVCELLSMRYAHIDHPRQADFNLQAFVQKHQIDFLSYVNADYEYVKKLERFRGVHLIRDPRDVIVSAYYSHRYSHPLGDWAALAAHRRELERLSVSEGLMKELEFSRPNLCRIQSWNYQQEQVLELTFEDLIKDPLQGIINVLCFFGIYRQKKSLLGSIQNFFIPGKSHLVTKELLRILNKHEFKKMSVGRKTGQEDVYSHYRSGTPGDWKRHFTKCHKEFFKSNYQGVLIKTAYEADDQW